MALDGKILAQAKSVFEKKRKQRDDEYGILLQRVYKKAPRVRVLDMELRATMAELAGAAFGVNSASRVEDIRVRNLQMQEERKNELIKAGFPVDYLDEKYMCQYCNDTGYVTGKMCECLKSIYDEEQKSSLSNLFKLGNETFDSFKLSYYDDTPKSDSSSPHGEMEIIYKFCRKYADNFGDKSKNLFFNGAPGLGKTFLSACIARVVAENGFSVVYDMATSMFAKFEDAKFNRTDDHESARNEIKRYMECDLLIIDDLGTEMVTAFTISALYEIINTRLVTGKKTIINSNLTIEELHRKYSEQIMSRLEGEHHVLTFRGDDIRKKKNIV